MTRHLSHLWSLLTEPSPRVIEKDQRGNARTLTVFILFSLLLFPIPVIFKYQSLSGLHEARVSILLLLVPGITAYVLARTRFFAAGAMIEALAFWAGIVVTSTIEPNNKVSLCFLLIPVMICAATVNRKTTTLMAGFCLLTDAWLYLRLPRTDQAEMVGTQVFLLFGVSLILYIQRNQASLEKEREKAMRSLVANQKSLLASTFDGTAIQIQGRIIEADPGFANLFGLDESEIVYNPVSSLFPDQEQEKLGQVLAQESGRPVELRIRHAEGKSRWVEMICQQNTERVREPHFILAARDVTERKAMQQQVIFTGRMVAMGTLAAGVAHEINNPLTYIMGHQQLLSRELKPLLEQRDRETQQQVQHRLHVIREGIDRVKQIVSDLKTFSRDDDEAVSVVDLAQVADTAVQMTWNEIRHRAQLVRDVQDAPLVAANPAHLGQVVVNLLMNAAQSMPEDSSSPMRIALNIGTAEDGRACLSVQDNGPGIPPNNLHQIFEPFFTTKAIGQGTGLGLSICHNIVQRYGGEIKVESSPEGTCFRILLPPTTEPLPSPSKPPDITTVKAIRQCQILVVDDEPEIAHLLREMLFDHEVSIAKDGRQALEIWGETDFDIVICDLMMPRVSGMDVYQTIKTRGEGREKRMIFITGGAFTSATRSFIAELDQPCLQKPFSPMNLRDLVSQVIAKGDA